MYLHLHLPPSSPRMACFCHGGFGFFLQRSRQNLDPSDFLFQRCRQKINPPDFILQRMPTKKFTVQIPAILEGGGGVRIKNGTSRRGIKNMMYQGPKLTFLCRRQVATEIFFFSRQMKKFGRQKVVCKIFAS